MPLKKRATTEEPSPPTPSRIWGEITIKMNLGDFESVDVTVGTEYPVNTGDDPQGIRDHLRAEMVREMQSQATAALIDLDLVRSGTSTAGRAAVHFKEE